MKDTPSKDPDEIRRMFGSIAGRYDLLNRVLSLNIDSLWRKNLCRRATGKRYLDVACGTGDVMRSLSEKKPEVLVGIDFSYPMLREGTNKKVPGQFLQGDGLNLPFVDGSFTTLTCAFGVRNFVDREQAFSEFYRVLEPGGRVLILEFFPPGDEWYLAPYRFYLRRVLPKIGEWVSGSSRAYSYLQESVEAFASRDQVREELLNSGFTDVRVDDLTGGVATIIQVDRT